MLPTAFELEATLRRLAPELPQELMGAADIAHAEAFARGMPAIFHWLVLESRLTAGGRSGVDLLAGIMRLAGREAELRARADGSDGAARHPATHAARFLMPWVCGDDPLLDHARVLWLEWDAPFTRLEPLQLFAIEPRFWGPFDALKLAPALQVEMARVGYARSFGEPADERVLALLRTAIEALPPCGRALFTASLRPRGVAVDRLFVKVPSQGVRAWLDAIGWPGDRALLDRWLGRAVAFWEDAYLQIELDADGIGPYLGIEPEQTSGGGAETRERRRFLDWLVAEGATTAAKADAVVAWEGRHPGERDGVATIEMRTFHVKVVLGQRAEPEVKAYLGVHTLA